MLSQTGDKKTSKDRHLYTCLADEILSYIETERIQSGERIPSERRLAEIFSTSRTSVREAVRILENKNILEVQIGNGMYLKPQLPTSIYRIELWKIDYMEMLEIKTVLEIHVLEELCAYIDPSSIRPIEEALLQLEIGYQNGIYDQAADILFHKRIRDSSKNQTLKQLLDGLTSKLDDYAGKMDESKRSHYWYDTIPYHRVLLEGIKEHNAGKAVTAFRNIYELDKQTLNGEN